MTISQKQSGNVRTLVKSCRILERMSRSNPKSQKSEPVYYRMLGNYFERIVNAVEDGKPIALHTVFMPVEILYAMDIVPIHAETSTWMTAAFSGEGSNLLTKAAEMGLATEICSAHRGLAGAYALGIMPRPTVVMWSSLMCDNTAKSGDLLMEINHCPGFFLDHPFNETPDEVAYLVGELKKMVAFLEERTGHKMDWDKLSEIIARSDRQIQLARKVSDLRKAVPSPFPPQRFMELITPYYLLPGQPEAIEYMETIVDDLTDMVAKKQGATDNERFRLMTLYVPPTYLLGFLGKIAQEHGAVSVCEPFFSFWGEGRLDPAKPLEGLAKKSFMFPEMGSYGIFKKETLDSAVENSRAYKVDGAIFYAHVGCRQAAGTLKLYKDALNKAGVPVLTLDFDILDPTVASESEIRQKLEQFFELLEGG
jgi:benzoyl-CoA reductase/2-hydroxyglutaryl-CoA dehydratase subunit BcrC/BadD/HgdB